MTTALTLLLLFSPLAAAGTITWAAQRSRMAAGAMFADDRDGVRISHDTDAIRTRFERQPTWPSSGALGERR